MRRHCLSFEGNIVVSSSRSVHIHKNKHKYTHNNIHKNIRKNKVIHKYIHKTCTDKYFH